MIVSGALAIVTTAGPAIVDARNSMPPDLKALLPQGVQRYAAIFAFMLILVVRYTAVCRVAPPTTDAGQGRVMARIDAAMAGGRNRVAFLDAIAVSEIGAALLAISDDGYNVLVDSTPSRPLLFSSYIAHPNGSTDRSVCRRRRPGATRSSRAGGTSIRHR